MKRPNYSSFDLLIKLLVYSLPMLLMHTSARAQDVAANSAVDEWNEITIRAQKDPVKTTIPTVTSKWTELDFHGINMHNPEDAIKYMPNLFIRKRFIGDRNGVLSIRGSSPFQNGRTLVYVDGVLLTDLIQDRFNAPPKWQVVAPDEIVSSEIIYGPYSALYSGNSMNGVVNIKTRQPNQRETTIKGSYFVQEYSDYGVDSTFDGFDHFISFGDRIGKLSLYGFIQHLENDAQPMSIAARAGSEIKNALPGTTNQAAVPVTGFYVDKNSLNESRYIMGSTSFTHTDQDLYKLKLAYEITDTLRAQFTLGYWVTTDTDSPAKNYLINRNTGAPFWGGPGGPLGSQVFAESGGKYFLVTSDQFTVNERDRRDLLMGLTLEGALTDTWDFQTILTYYNIPKDESLTSDENPLDPLYDGSGRVQEFGATYWWSYDLKLGNDEFLGYDTLGLTYGYQYNEYVFNIKEWNSTAYHGGLKDGSLRNDDGGTTNLNALYAQLDWNFIARWTAAFGLRQEWWEARDGHDFASGKQNYHSDRDEEDISPKFSLLFEPDEAWDVRLSLAKAVRYPVITEIFTGDEQVRSTLASNPKILPEEVFAKEFIIERVIPKGVARLTFFHNDESDTIFRDNGRVTVNNQTVTQSLFVNIDEVLTQGIELAVDKDSVIVAPLDLRFSASFNDTEIKKYKNNPAYEGNRIPRVPEWRISMLSTYHITTAWDVAVGMRYGSDAFDRLDNTDTNSDTYQAISDYLVWDCKTGYKFAGGLEVALGVDNIFSYEYHMAHPFPERSYFIEGKLQF